ncbi:thioredoxin-like protein [Lipomyces oligophaga]|uniref:thioredoxin-like protein n=1 Tax=Lipomyces oligophaga TaxID=45792 RepID=UPI0034CDBA97
MRILELFLPLLLVTPASAGFYGKNTDVLNLDPKTFKDEIMNTNHTSIVEFYAEWCGHCRQLRPHYIKAASSLKGIAKVAAVRCDDSFTQPLCQHYNVKGYPTLKIFTPPKIAGSKPRVEDYQGQRTAKAIANTVIGHLRNHVKRLTDSEVIAWLEESTMPSVLLFTDKTAIPPMFKALAIDYSGTADFGYLKKGEKAIAKQYGITKYPAVVVLTKNNDGSTESHFYSGEHKKELLYDYISKYAMPTEGPKKGQFPENMNKPLGHEEL